jgi:hypothetical protein
VRWMGAAVITSAARPIENWVLAFSRLLVL